MRIPLKVAAKIDRADRDYTMKKSAR